MAIDVGIDYSGAVKDVLPELISDGEVVEFSVMGVDEGETGQYSKTPGRPKLTWKLQVINHDKFTGRYLPWVTTVLPFVDADGKPVTSGLFVLMGLLKSIGKKWEGTSIDGSDFVGYEGKAIIGQEEYRGEDPDLKGTYVNTVKKFI